MYSICLVGLSMGRVNRCSQLRGHRSLTSVSRLSRQLMEPVQGPERLVLPDVTAFIRPVLGVFDEIADRQPDVALDRGEDPDHPAPPADLHVQPLLAGGRATSRSSAPK